MSKVTYILNGLDCAHCASKIETAVKGIEGVNAAYVDFSKSKLVYAYDEGNGVEIPRNTIEAIVHQFEPDVTVSTPSEVKDEHGETEEQFEKLRLGAALLLFIAAMALPSLPRYFEVGLLFGAYAISGFPVILKAFKNLKNKQWLDENFLMFIASAGAIAIGEYPEAAAVMLFYEIGEYFQDLAVGKSRSSIASLMNIRPDVAHVMTPEGLVDRAPEFISIGDLIRVKPGERVPLDGVIVNGETTVDVSALTGEALPQHLKASDAILSGSVVNSGVIDIRTTKRYEDSTVSKILDLVEDATAHKSPTENFITKFARFYTPIVVSLAALIVIAPTLYFGASTFDTWLYRGLIFLVISCPCALVISVPLSFFSGIGSASSHGVLVKGSNYLEGLNAVDTIVFDKTGTLTHGKLAIKALMPTEGATQASLLSIAKRIESHSNHPIAKAILASSGDQQISTPQGFMDLSEKYEELSGKGVMATLDGKCYLAGTAKLLTEYGITYDEVTDHVGTVVYISENERYLGAIVLEDEIKANAADAIKRLKHLGKKVVMLTGDQNRVANAVADQLGIEVYHAELLPADKYSKVSAFMSGGQKVAFVGDGINDAPVLAGANIGISMGELGSDAAIEASDIVIMNDDLLKIVDAFAIAQRTKHIVTQNIVFALGIKLVIMLMGAFGLSSMWMAIFADVGVALLAILNAMRSLRYKPVKAHLS